MTEIPGEFPSGSEEIVCRFEFPEKPAYIELLDLYEFGIREEFQAVGSARAAYFPNSSV